jgi:hypothetical protein
MMMTWIRAYVESLTRSDRPEQTPWAVVLCASAALILILAAVGLSCALRIVLHGDLGPGAVTAFGLALTAVTTHLIHSNRIGAAASVAPGVTSTVENLSGCAGHADGGNL